MGLGTASLNQVTEVNKGQLPSLVSHGEGADTEKAAITIVNNNQKQRKKLKNNEKEIVTTNNLIAATKNQPIVGIKQNSTLLNDNFTVFNTGILNNQNKQKLINKVD